MVVPRGEGLRIIGFPNVNGQEVKWDGQNKG
jgi:hypothetical protein